MQRSRTGPGASADALRCSRSAARASTGDSGMPPCTSHIACTWRRSARQSELAVFQPLSWANRRRTRLTTAVRQTRPAWVKEEVMLLDRHVRAVPVVGVLLDHAMPGGTEPRRAQPMLRMAPQAQAVFRLEPLVPGARPTCTAPPRAAARCSPSVGQPVRSPWLASVPDHPSWHAEAPTERPAQASGRSSIRAVTPERGLPEHRTFDQRRNPGLPGVSAPLKWGSLRDTWPSGFPRVLAPAPSAAPAGRARLRSTRLGSRRREGPRGQVRWAVTGLAGRRCPPQRASR